MIEIFVLVISILKISSLFLFAISRTFCNISSFELIPYPITEIFDISFFTMLFTPELSRLCVISVPFLSLNVDSVIIGTSNFSPISTHLS